MLKPMLAILRFTWVLAFLIGGTAFGASYGWEHHGWFGAIAVGFVGLAVGALLAGSPRLVLQLLN
jgi:hypothetical protein